MVPSIAFIAMWRAVAACTFEICSFCLLWLFLHWFVVYVFPEQQAVSSCCGWCTKTLERGGKCRSVFRILLCCCL